jgi:hypothetical protein
MKCSVTGTGATVNDDETGKPAAVGSLPDRTAQDAPRPPGPPDILLRFTMKNGAVNEFFPILQQGFRVTARVGCTLRKLLCEQFALESDYVTDRITTIFLNGRATDDLDTAIIRDGSTLALSAAMPGLVGATMRRGGYYAAMRSGITHIADQGGGENGIGSVRIKLFNMLLPELGPDFLRRGVVVDGTDMVDFLAGRSGQFCNLCTEAFINGTPVEPGLLLDGTSVRNCRTVRLTVSFKGEA